MPRIVGVDLPKDKKLLFALPYIFGVGLEMSRRIIQALNLDPNLRANRLKESEIAQINSFIQSHYQVEGDLRRDIQQNIKRLVSIGCYRGSRHKAGLPARGQRTRTNARTRKGKKKTIANKKVAPKK